MAGDLDLLGAGQFGIGRLDQLIETGLQLLDLVRQIDVAAGRVHAQALAGRYTPGTFTNQVQKRYVEPRLLIVTNPRMDHQPVLEASYSNIPVIAFTDADSPMRYIDVAIPANNRGKNSIGLLYWLLTREVLRLRGMSRAQPWDVKVDLFFYREPEEVEKAQLEAEGEGAQAAIEPDAGVVAGQSNPPVCSSYYS